MNIKTLLILFFACLLASCHRNVVKLADSNPAEFSSSIGSDNIYAMQTDGHGYLWIGTDRGLSIYDGSNYRNMCHDNADSTSLRSNNVYGLFKDKGDSMWVLTDDGIDCYLGKGIFKHYLTDAVLHTPGCMTQKADGTIVALFGGELCSLKDGIFKKTCKLLGSYTDGDRTSMYEAGDGRLLVTTSEGVFIVNRDLRHHKKFPVLGSVIACADKDNICILSFNSGIYVLNRKDLSVAYHSNKGMPMVAENATLLKGRLLFSGYEGIYAMNMRSHVISPLPQEIQDDVHPKFIQRLYVGNDGLLWIGYNRQFKIKRIASLREVERSLWLDKTLEVFKHHGVVGVTQDDSGNIFGALDNDSLFYLDRLNGILSSYLGDVIPVHSRQHVKSVYYSAGFFWVVTTSNVFALQYNRGFHVAEFFDVGLVTNNRCGAAVPVDNGLALLGSNAIFIFDALHRARAVDDIRQAANRKPVMWRKGDFSIKTIHIKSSDISLGSQLVNLGRGRLLSVFQDYKPWIINLYNGNVVNANFTLDASVVCSANKDGHAFIGTDNGLFIYDGNNDRLTKVGEFGTKPINNLSVTNRGGIVLTCEGNILSFDPTTHHIRRLWQGSPQKDFQPSTLALQSRASLFAATRDGFQKFDVKEKSKGDVRPRLYIESLDAVMANNTHRSCSLFDADSTMTVSLSYNENTIDIKYAAIPPSMPGKYTYRYRLRGYDDNWQYSDESGAVEYAKVGPGKYRFEISCTDQQRPWLSVSKSLTIRVKPHPLLSQAAICIYVIIVLLAIFFANRLYIRMRIVRINADNAAKERQREQDVNKMNMNFFANISHEFRNPITMIAGPVSMLRKAPELSKQSANMVRLISQSAKILMKLVNQMLDFNLLEGEAMRLSVERIDVAAVISEYVRHYSVSAAEKEITIETQGTDKPVVMLADEDKIIKVLDNLMSNALKHTPQGGKVGITLKTDNDRLQLSVENSGTHIPEESLDKIFERYYMASNDVADWGVGLGLHYVRSLVTLHHGTIVVANTVDGVIFSVSLPMNDDAYSAEERKPRTRPQIEHFIDDDILRPHRVENNTLEVVQGNDTSDKVLPRLLIVEKDVNTAYFLRRLFEKDYMVINRYDAETTLEDVDTIKPDVIISCVMLNGKSGLDLCRTLRQREDYADTPFIFLTTCNSGEQQADGIRAGADAYIIKPFEPDYLREVVAKNLVHANAFKELQQQLPQPKVKTDNGLSTRDKEILRIMRKFMKDNISDGELDVVKLSRRLLLSRTKLYEKVKELTGKTPNELFRTFKLSYAAELLKEGKLNVSEVSEKAGFSSVAFFSRTFKKYYGVSPKDYD